MAKAQDKRKKQAAQPKNKNKSKSKPSPSSATELLSQAIELLQQGQPDLALPPAQTALSTLQSAHGASSTETLPALSLVAEIQLDLGDVPAATTSFLAAVKLDPDGRMPESEGGGADKFLNLAQLDETGGASSLKWYEKAVTCLERDIAELDGQVTAKTGDASKSQELEFERAQKRAKLGQALCAMCELWMTDLSFDDAAEGNCERLITQAVMVAPEEPQTLQTLASIRLSQQRVEEAQAALEQSLEVWMDLPTGHPLVPEYAARIALARTLMEAGMGDHALEVCERLVGEDDQSIEAWYLGGWCQYLAAQEQESEDDDGDDEMKEDTQNEDDEEDDDEEPLSAEDRKALKLSSREWLRNCLKLYQILEYEDDRLRDHAKELVGALDKELGNAEIEDDDEWDGMESDNDEDEEMGES